MPTYPGAPDSLIDRWQERRAPLHARPGEGLPPLTCDLAALAATPLPQKTAERQITADEPPVTGFVFKVQANMDPKHR
ncbi:MAG: hypothetical protein IE927_13365, partial [Rhodobacterales bacterium]|nr:hypothetical protein [Rhodobacterales bacterium]